MKKICIALFAMFAMTFSVLADESFALGFWFDAPKGIASTEVEGIALGVPVISCGNLEGAVLAICGTHTKRMEGLAFAWLGFNYAKSLEGIQLAFVNLQDGQHGDFSLQIGAYNQSAENGVQLGFINNARDNATFQFGFININKNGLLPAMIFVNFGRDFFSK